MSSDSLKRSYSVGAYSVYVGNAKAYERGTSPLRAFVSETDAKTGESRVIESFYGSSSEVDAIALVEKLTRERETQRMITRNPVKRLLRLINQKKAVAEKQKADEAKSVARLKARMESEWNENE
jgi:hypothetical protein